MLSKHKRKSDSGIKIELWHWLEKHSYWIIMLVAAVFVCFVFLISYPLNKNEINSEKNAEFAESWQYSIDDGAYQPIVLPFSEKAHITSHITLKNRLPPVLVKGVTILLRTSQQNAVVYVDDVEVYSSFDKSDERGIPSSAYHFARLPTDGAGKEITIVLTSPIERYAGQINEIYMGSKASHIFFLFTENGFRFASGLFIFIVGFVMIISFLFAKAQKGKNAVLALGAFFVCAGFWLSAESRLVQFIFPYPFAITNVGIYVLALLPVFFALYYHSSHEGDLAIFGKRAITGMMLASFGVVICAVINPYLPLRVMPFYLGLIGIYIALVFAALLAEGIRKGEFFTLHICGGLGFVAFSLIEMCVYLSNVKGSNKSNFLTVGLWIFCIVMLIDAIQTFTKIQKAALKVNTLTLLAYTDSLTGLQNRRAFLEQIALVDMNQESGVSLAMFDINNLKPVNDTLGHLMGDAMLCHSAKAISDSLRQSGAVYRIGGDEFAAILHHDNSFDINSIEERMEAVLALENQKPLSYRLSIAYGCATFDQHCDKNLLETLARADEKMYICKKHQKEMMKLASSKISP